MANVECRRQNDGVGVALEVIVQHVRLHAATPGDGRTEPASLSAYKDTSGVAGLFLREHL
jgi:hypothetical protein